VPVITAIVVLQALLILLLLLSRNSLRRAQSALKESEERLKDTLETANRVFRYMETVRENERKHIAREIHDELGQAMTALKIELLRLKNTPRAEIDDFSEAIDQMSDLVSDTIRDVQRISSELRPRLLDDLGLVAAIEWLAQEFSERMGIPCNFDRRNAESCSGTACSTAIFRIVQESLTNICRHAQASQVEISLDCGSGNALLKIVDDGIGISKDQLSSEESLGLLGIMERAHMCGGRADIFGEPGKGTTVTATIPCSIEDEGNNENTYS
jgi:signal transduction histidine kinase